jgi:quinol monooxygenase YgiN
MAAAPPAFAAPLSLRAPPAAARARAPTASRCSASEPPPHQVPPYPGAPTRAAPAPARTNGGAKRVATVRAPVVDVRVAFANEAHHWLTVSSGGKALFERAAVAQADMVRVVEREAGGGALHRWVLRAVEDPLGRERGGGDVNGVGRYVVMETYKEGGGDLVTTGAMDRWLGAIAAAGEKLDCAVSATLRYANVFTTKMHGATFDVHRSIVVAESVQAEAGAAAALRQVLEGRAEAAVAAGDCLEFCVLEATCKDGLFKTIEVYADVDALREHMDGLDAAFVESTAPLVALSGHRARSSFKPVVFS